MVRASRAAILVCAVMVLVAAAPLAFAGTHEVVKGPNGPRASAVTWSFVAPDYGMWYGHIINNGLRSLVVEVADVSTGVPVEVMHQRIQFAKYPSNDVMSWGVIMAMGRAYEITVVPNGVRGSSCMVEDYFDPAVNPTADFTATLSSLTVSVDATASIDPDGTIVGYAWSFGDGSAGSGVTASHTYAAQGPYDITLTVTDNEGLTGVLTKTVNVVDNPPVAVFVITSVDRLTVSVDASGSSDDYGIVSYAWSWGDGATGTGVTASHTYLSGPAAQVVNSAQVSVRQPQPPHNVQGLTLDMNMVPIPNCQVTITNLRTGEAVVTYSDPEYGWYEYDLNTLALGWLDGDIIQVDATAPGYSGSASAPVLAADPYLALDVVLYPSVMTFTITLTVTDAQGQQATMSLPVSVSP